MNDELLEYTFDEIEVGLKKEFQIKITESLVNDFAKISGDFSPIHINEEYAKGTIFKKRIVHGMLLSSLLSKIQGMYLPGKRALYFSQTLNFRNPCYIDDIVTVSGKVIAKSESTKILKIESVVKNQDNKIIISGIGRVIVRDD
tara:strand:+ start:287 stop:718 length:432 start_codon:yes stop_codon:yes gene_type:complete